MKLVFGLAVLTLLAGCAVDQTAPGRYGNMASAQPRDPAQWRVVSVTPVPAGTAAQVAAKSADGKPVEFSSTALPAPSVYAQAPVYLPRTVYGPPVYGPEPAYYWPPVSLSLGFVFGRHWGGGRYGGRHRRH